MIKWAGLRKLSITVCYKEAERKDMKVRLVDGHVTRSDLMQETSSPPTTACNKGFICKNRNHSLPKPTHTVCPHIFI